MLLSILGWPEEPIPLVPAERQARGAWNAYVSAIDGIYKSVAADRPEILLRLEALGWSHREIGQWLMAPGIQRAAPMTLLARGEMVDFYGAVTDAEKLAASNASVS